MTATVILAAGASRRLGRPKQMERLGGELLLERAVRVANEAGLGLVLVVVDPAEAAVVGEAQRLRCAVVRNEGAGEGMASSIRVGVAALPEGVRGVVIMTCDQPAVTSAHLRALAEGGAEVVASAYAGRRGVPAFFAASALRELLALRGDAGARTLLQEARALPLPMGELDVDTEAEMTRARALLAEGELG